MENPTRRGTAFEIVPWAAPNPQGEFGLGDLLGRIGSGIGGVAGRVADAARGAGIIDLTAQGDKSLRKGQRDLRKVHALVLHQMACCFRRKDPLKDYLRLGAHFAILPDGRILQIHPVRELVWASNGFNNGSVAVEFAGNFPNTKGKWWQGDKFGRNQVTPAQIEAGRRLVRHLVKTMGLRTILAHRQSSATRENDPGPDIWYGVGQWAVDTLGLKDGGPGFKVGEGKPIPDLWRAWGRAKPASPAREAELDEAEQEVVFGPLTATLNWLPNSSKPRAYTRDQVLAKGGNVGGVYIAFRESKPGDISNISIQKVGMADTFARRIQAYPRDWRFFLAEVRGHRGGRGVAGVVRMVEFALARLLRRVGRLTGPQLPRLAAPTLGPVRVVNVLPKPLEAQLQPALFNPVFNPVPAERGQALPRGTQVTAGQLALPAGFRWEAEQPFQG